VKRALTILTAVVFLASGMHINLASHYCHGKLAAVRISCTGEKATCGMEVCQPESTQAQNTFSNLCCEDNISTNFLSDYNNTPSVELTVPGQKIHQPYGIPFSLSMNQQYIIKVQDSNSRPPGIYYPDDPSCPFLCIFRI
jgi:hypothetical protein